MDGSCRLTKLIFFASDILSCDIYVKNRSFLTIVVYSLAYFKIPLFTEGKYSLRLMLVDYSYRHFVGKYIFLIKIDCYMHISKSAGWESSEYNFFVSKIIHLYGKNLG